MIYLEMSKDKIHGGENWEFQTCIWAPTKKRGSGYAWPFWSKILLVRKDDLIIHLRGDRPRAEIVGYSVASGSGFETDDRPPKPDEWGFSDRFYRANLISFTPLHQKLNLDDVFTSRKSELEDYYFRNKNLDEKSKKNIFFTRQRERLQCLNGAYLSDVDEELLTILFNDNTPITNARGKIEIISVETSSQFTYIKSRLGQSKFAENIKNLYSNKCCFPSCSITDSRFLVASHIARWADNEKLRGDLGNGLCFCLMHDKAFEEGLFTLDNQFRIIVNSKECSANSDFFVDLRKQERHQISLAEEIKPLKTALKEHWKRVKITP